MPLMELPNDVWRLIWDMLSVPELAKVARVAKAWKDASDERIKKRREAAMARVKAPDDIPDDKLSKPQRVFRAMRRHLLGKDPFMGEPVSGPCTELVKDNFRILTDGEGDLHPQQLRESRFNFHVWLLYLWEASSKWESICMRMDWEALQSQDDPYNPSTPIAVQFHMNPRSTDECEWMQGLVLALSEEPLGEPCDRGDSGPQTRGALMRGLFSRCIRLRIRRSKYLLDSKDLMLPLTFDSLH